ncbi:MAG: DNA-binding NarL/FixJ family response regulator, partial [Bacteroidia bacterium]
MSIEIIHYTSNQLAIYGLKGLIANDDGYSVKDCATSDDLFSNVSGATSLIVINDHELGDDLRDLISNVRDRSIETPILLIADTSQAVNVLKTVDLGVQGFLTKECGSDEIIHSIHSLIKGERFFCNNVLNILLDKSTIEEEED